MTPTTFPQANTNFGPPPDMAESQVMTIPAFIGETKSGSCDGALLVIVAWKPTLAEIQAMIDGAPIFLSCLGGLPPHFLTVDFNQATHPA